MGLGSGDLTVRPLAAAESVTGTAQIRRGSDIAGVFNCIAEAGAYAAETITGTEANPVPDFHNFAPCLTMYAQMRRSCLLLSWCVLVACAGPKSGSADAHFSDSSSLKAVSDRTRLVPARYFVDPSNRRHSVAAVREVTEPRVTIAG